MKPGSDRRTRSPVAGPDVERGRRAVRSAHRFHLHLRRHLSRARQGGSARAAPMQYRGDEPAPGEIATAVAPRCHAGLLLDQAGWHLSHQLAIPPNITLVPLPAKCPNSTRSRTSGNSSATTGSPTACSSPTTISSTTVATPGTTRRSAVDHHVHRSARLGI